MCGCASYEVHQLVKSVDGSQIQFLIPCQTFSGKLAGGVILCSILCFGDDAVMMELLLIL